MAKTHFEKDSVRLYGKKDMHFVRRHDLKMPSLLGGNKVVTYRRAAFGAGQVGTFRIGATKSRLAFAAVQIYTTGSCTAYISEQESNPSLVGE